MRYLNVGQQVGDTQANAVNAKVPVQGANLDSSVDTSLSQAPTIDNNAIARAESMISVARNKAPQQETTNADYYPSEGAQVSQGVIAPIYTPGSILLPLAAADKIQANKRAMETAEQEAILKDYSPEFEKLKNIGQDPALQQQLLRNYQNDYKRTEDELREQGKNPALAGMAIANSREYQNKYKNINNTIDAYNGVYETAVTVLSKPNEYSPEVKKYAQQMYQATDDFTLTGSDEDFAKIREAQNKLQGYKAIDEVVGVVADNLADQSVWSSDVIRNTNDYDSIATLVGKGNFLKKTKDNKGNESIGFDMDAFNEFADNQYNTFYEGKQEKPDKKVFDDTLFRKMKLDATYKVTNPKKVNTKAKKDLLRTSNEIKNPRPSFGKPQEFTKMLSGGGTKQHKGTSASINTKNKKPHVIPNGTEYIDENGETQTSDGKVLVYPTNVIIESDGATYTGGQIVEQIQDPNAMLMGEDNKPILDDDGNAQFDPSKKIYKKVGLPYAQMNTSDVEPYLKSIGQMPKGLDIKKSYAEGKGKTKTTPKNTVKSAYMKKYGITNDSELTDADLKWIKENSK